MSDPVIITIPHRLGKDEAIRRMRSGLASANLAFVTIDRASSLAQGLLPVAEQRRQEIAQHRARSGLDFHRHRHAG